MSRALRAVAAVGIVVTLLAIGGAVAAEEHPEHEHPDEVSDEDDLAGLERWLGDRMGEIHVDCTEGMRVGNYDACEDLDEDYESLLERYVTAERETTADEEDREADKFEETREKQDELADLMQNYSETYDEYRDARQAGDQQRALQRARELIRLADRIRELGGDVETNFRILDGTTSSDLNESAAQTREMTDEVVLTVQEIERESFERTNVTLTIDDRAAFDDPATARGNVTDENGTAIADARVVLDDNETTFETRADENGTYTLEYRPTLTEVGATNVTVRYVPAEDSEYLGSNATATVDVEPTQPIVAVTDTTSAAAFGENVTATGAVGAAGEPVANVSVVVAVEGEPLATTRTDRDGRFEATGQLPATVPDGEATVTVRASEAVLALSPAYDRTSLSVLETDTNLSATSVVVDGDGEVSGRLTADAPGDAQVGQRPLTVTVGDEERTVTTDDNGRYSLAVAAGGGAQDVVVEYDEPGTNLAPSRAGTTMETDQGVIGTLIEGARGYLNFLLDMIKSYPLIAAFFLLGILVNLVVWGNVWLTQRHPGGEGSDSGLAGDVGGPGSPTGSDDPTGGPSTAVLLLEAARDRLDRSPEAAVQVCYAAVRNGLGGGADARTHWEFYNERRDDLEGRRAAALRSVTESFEQATFARTGVDGDRARTALEDAERCLAAGDGGADRPTD